MRGRRRMAQKLPGMSKAIREELTIGPPSLDIRTGEDETPATIRNQTPMECTMSRNETEVQRDDEQSAAIAKAMVSVVAAMALVMVVTVLAFQSGGSILV